MRWQVRVIVVGGLLGLCEPFGLSGMLDALAPPQLQQPVPPSTSLRRSPRETIEATVAGAQMTITYGRPYALGRQIMGELVPYGEIWRTGADEATTFETSHNLELGGALIPAGRYTLFTIPDATAWTLIINMQTEQWGTVYDDSQDMARVLIAPEETAAVEQFTIALEEVESTRGRQAADPTSGLQEVDPTSGFLTFEWETTRLAVPFIVK